MIGKSAFRNIIYPAQNRAPRATRYRIVLTKDSRLLRTVVYFLAEESTQLQRMDLITALDVVLNRIIEVAGIGMRHDCVQPVAQDRAQKMVYGIHITRGM